MRAFFDGHQIAIYFDIIVIGTLTEWSFPAATRVEVAINPALVLMLFVTFLQVPVIELSAAFRNVRFLIALLLAGFIAMPS